MSVRVGKLGIVRLKGDDLTKLRDDCYERDGGECVNCHRSLVKNPAYRYQPDAYHMSHIRNKRMYGDTMENVRAKCTNCHLIAEHNPKSVPSKG